MEQFETSTHSTELSEIFTNTPPDFAKAVNNDDSLLRFIKVTYRFFKHKLCLFMKQTSTQSFKQVLYITIDKPPLDYILAFQRQYPEKKIKVLLPVTQRTNFKKIFHFDFYIHNTINRAVLYEFPRNRENIEIYGLYSETWENGNLQRLQFLAPFMKAVRICAKKLKPNVVHSENIPFFLGAEFEPKRSYGIKVFQTIKDFSLLEMNKTEAFWAAINLVDKFGMQKICRDKIIRKCIASLFNLHNTKKFYQMRDCLDFIYQNYFKFRKYIDKCEDLDENILFNRMNARAIKLFPQMAYQDDLMYNIMYTTLNKVDYWAVTSKTYYEDIFKIPKISGKMFSRIESTKQKSGFVSYGCELKDKKLYQPFNLNNFRELREKNKHYLLKEFSKDRIDAKFVDTTLFEDENYTIKGYLESFYSSPLIFGTFTPEIFSQGIDIAFSTIFRLFDMNKNIQVIINIPTGLQQNYIKNAIEILEKNTLFRGRWLFIDGKINLAQFYASSDISIFSKRLNVNSSEHYLSLKYGCIPVALRNGIYNDTIKDIFDDITLGCGFKTKTSIYANNDASDIYYTTFIKALNLYTQNSASWNLLIKNALDYNSEWSFEIIEKYNCFYEKCLR